MTESQRYKRLGKYELHTLMGEGAMGIVWKAYDTVLRRFVALKLLGSHFRKTKDMQDRFLREARAAGAIQHPNIVTVYDLGEAEGQLFIAMELVEGRDLSDIITLREPMALERKLDIVIELLEGLHFAHQRGVIHRDVKPSNVRVQPDGRVKIMDFGIARLQTAADVSGSGAIVGTPTYMAPEQITNGSITAATDVFSVGCMLYELLSFQKPFHGESVHGVLYQVLTTEPKALRTLAPSIPAALERVVAKAMNKVPDERYESAGQMQATLLGIRAALSGAGEDTTQRLGIRWTPLPVPVLKLVTYAPMKWRVAVLSALAVVVALLLFSPRQPTADDTAPPPASVATPGPVAGDIPGVSATVGARRDSALAARDRAVQAGALKNNVPSMVIGEGILRASEQALQTGDQSRALAGYVGVVDQYRKARQEALVLEQEARRMLDRVAPVVQAIPTGPDAANAGVYFARAESLLREKDFTLAKVAAQSAEQIGITAGIAPPSSQPPDARGAINVLLTDLARALASERVANMRVLYPRMTDQERQGWEAFFRDWDQITATFTIQRFSASGTAAGADVQAVLTYIPAGGGAPREDRRRYAMRFEKREVGWRLSTVSELR
ncbi:MAG TPA: serine/threonine-protein kinase [Gemmatimonadales bacterium]|jgi:serine/threonine-protein kinase|nr:serine/threonine-protein kinase [Gemmatimonadales bacterium]